MKDQLEKHVEPEEGFSEALKSVVQKIEVNANFKAELGKQLAEAHQPTRPAFGQSALGRAMPVFGWVFALALMALVLNWMFRSIAPPPIPAAQETPSQATQDIPSPSPTEFVTPSPNDEGYDWHGAKLYLAQPLPQSPAKAHIYVMNKDEPATAEEARALADRFGIQGETYTTEGFIYGTTNYVFSDGKQSLQVHSDKYFTYTADLARHNRSFPKPSNPNAEDVIREFLNARGFDFPFRAYPSEFFGGYVVQLLAPDSIPMQYESFTLPMMRVVLDENGQVLTMDASLMNYDLNPIGEHGIISAQQAFDSLLNDSAMTGKMEFSHSPANMPKEWYQTYPDNQPVTIYGYVLSSPAVDPGKPALVLIDGVPMTGNSNGMESLDRASFIKATGQFIGENGIRKFSVESWDRQVNEIWVSGILSHQGDQVIITSDDGTGKQYPLIDPPADLPIGSQPPESSLGISGIIENDALIWHYIQFFESNGNSGGGGGAGGGLGFYKLNLSSIPVPFPSPTPQPEANIGTYVVTENDTIASIALNFGISVDALMQANGITENQVFTGQTLVIPNPQAAPPLTGTYTIQEGDTLTAIADRFGTTIDELMQLNRLTDHNIFVGQNLAVPFPEPVEQQVEALRGYLSVSIHKKSDGTSLKEYNLQVVDENGSTIYPMQGSTLSELDAYNALPILITGAINTEGKLVVNSYEVPYPDLHFQILKGTQRAEQLEGQTVIIFTTEAGTSYVEFWATNTFPSADSFTGQQGDPIEQEVLVIPDEAFGGLPVAHIYQSALIQENSPALEVQSNRINVYDAVGDPGLSTDIAPPNLIIDQVELVYYGSNPYYQVNNPDYSQRSPHIQPVWHFHGHYEDGSEFDIIIQALKQEFLLPEPAPGLSPG